jgi:hypothetical protein
VKRLQPGDHVVYRAGGGKGIYTDRGVFVIGDSWSGIVSWDYDALKLVKEPPNDR